MGGEVQLGQVGEIIMGQSPPGDTYNERGDGLPFFQGVADFNYRHPTPRVFCTAPSRIALPGDILLSVRAPIGRVNVADRICAIGRGLAVIRPKDQKDGRYLEFVLRMLEPTWHLIEGGGSVFGNATRRDLETLRIPWHENACERSAIAHILGTLDDKIELDRRMSETLEEMARALFKAWFVDFEPVRAKMEGRWRRGESLPGFPAHLYDLFPDRLVQSELGEIPEGWKVGTLADLAALNPESWNDTTRPRRINYVDLSNVKWGRIEKVVAYDRTKAPSRAQRVLRPGDTIVGTVRPGNGSYAFISDDGLTGSTGFAVLRPRKRECVEFIYLAASSADNIEALAHVADGAAYPAVRPQVVAGSQVVLPPDEILSQFSKVAGPILIRVARNDNESRTLAGLRDALLPKLILGEIRVKDAESFLKERGL